MPLLCFSFGMLIQSKNMVPDSIGCADSRISNCELEERNRAVLPGRIVTFVFIAPYKYPAATTTTWIILFSNIIACVQNIRLQHARVL